MNKKLTAKQLLLEVQQLKKLASKDWLEDYVFVYEDEEDLLGQVESWAAQHVSQHYIEVINVQGDIAYVTYTRTQPIRVQKQKVCIDWWKQGSECDQDAKQAIEDTYGKILSYMENWAKKTGLDWKIKSNIGGKGAWGHVEMKLVVGRDFILFNYVIARDGTNKSECDFYGLFQDPYDVEKNILTPNIDESMDKCFTHFKSVFDKEAPKILMNYLDNKDAY